MPAHWLIKSEPSVYSYARLEKDRKTTWDGVRNFEARNNLRRMKKGDLCLFYHSGEGKEVVGIARVRGEAYADPTTEEDWSVVDVEPLKRLVAPVTLAQMKDDPQLGAMVVVKKSRLSVTPVTPAEFDRVLSMGKTRLA
jgi:predicted RNA-binding protein with PUA-like domain